MKTILALLLLSASCFAAISNETQETIMRSARQADLEAYFYSTGVVLYDVPEISPFFACQRAYIYKGQDITGALMVDRVSCQYNSYYRTAWQGIQKCNRNDASGRFMIERSLMSQVSFSC